MGFIGGIVKRLIRLILYLALVVVFITLIPNLPPYTKFSRIELESTQPSVGALANNDLLNNAKALYKDKLLGPEAFQVWNGDVYTGLATGEIVKVSPGGHVTFVTKIGQPCKGLVEEHICGRPLGFVIDEKNKLIYVADAYHGIWKVNLVTDKKQLLVSPRMPIDGRVPKVFNSVALDKNGDLYWTDSSSDFNLKDGVFISLADPTGRLFHYNAAKNISNVLLDDLWFANGVIISSDNQYVLVSESSRYRILKYYINGPKKGTSEVFAAGLPGVPDNLRLLPDGTGFLSSLYIAFDDENPLLTKTMSPAHLARKFIARITRLIEIPFEFLQSQFPNYIFENIVYQIGGFASISSFIPGKTGLLQFDWNGNIVASYYNNDGTLLHISDAIVYNNKLYTACPHIQNFIGVVAAPPQLIKAFTNNKAKEQPRAESISPKINKAQVKDKKDLPKKMPVTQPTPSPTKPNKIPATLTTTAPTIPKKTPVTLTTPPPTTTQKPTKSNNIPKEKVAEPNSVPKDVKSESTPKESERTKKLESNNDARPKHVKKQVDEKSVPRNADIKSKNTPDAETRLKDAEKVPELKLKKTQPKPTIKEQESQGRSVKETETKVKISETNDRNTETNKKAPTHSKTINNQPEVKAAKNSAEQKSEPKNTNTMPKVHTKQIKTTEADRISTKKESVPEVIPIEENIPSDTAKPNKETLKVIKKSGPQIIPHPNL